MLSPSRCPLAWSDGTRRKVHRPRSEGICRLYAPPLNKRSRCIQADSRLILSSGSRRFDMSLSGLEWSGDETVGLMAVWSADGDVTLFGDAAELRDLRVALLAAARHSGRR
jgi:hypothetical protein